MYLLLFTQDLILEVGTKYQENCLRCTTDSSIVRMIQTDIKLKKELDLWLDRYSIDIGTSFFNIDSVMGTVKGVVRAYADGSDQNRWDDLFSAGMYGVSFAYNNFDPDKGELKSHVRRNVRNHIMMELRKMQRWDREIPFTNLKREDASGGVEVSPEDDDHSGDDNIPESIWTEPSMNPEEQCIRAEEIRIAREKVHKLQSGFNERELYILWNHIIGEESMTLREIASQFKVDKSSIYRDVVRIKKLLEIKETD